MFILEPFFVSCLAHSADRNFTGCPLLEIHQVVMATIPSNLIMCGLLLARLFYVCLIIVTACTALFATQTHMLTYWPTVC
jgi:hypothetical protein